MSSGAKKNDSGQGSGAGKEHFVKKVFAGGEGASSREGAEARKKGRAHIPSTVMTVEYIDDSEGMDAALKALEGRIGKLEQVLSSLREAHGEMASAINQQIKEIQEFVVSITRRMDRLYKTIMDVAPEPEQPPPSPVEAPVEETEQGLPAQFADDADHQQAWRTARVLAADLDAYYPDRVREGVLYGNFHELLGEQIERARKTYEQRVPERVVREFDHFARAIEALIARKRQELEQELST